MLVPLFPSSTKVSRPVVMLLDFVTNVDKQKIYVQINNQQF